MLQKPNKLGYTTVTSYRVIRFLNYLGNVWEKIVTDMFSEWCEMNHVLHEGQMRSRKQRSAIDAVARVVIRVQEA